MKGKPNNPEISTSANHFTLRLEENNEGANNHVPMCRTSNQVFSSDLRPQKKESFNMKKLKPQRNAATVGQDTGAAGEKGLLWLAIFFFTFCQSWPSGTFTGNQLEGF